MSYKVQLWAFRPGSDEHVILPRPLSWEASFIMSDRGSLQLTYRKDDINYDILNGYDENGEYVGCDIEVRVLDGGTWVCLPQGRFEIVDWDSDLVTERGTHVRQYTAQSWSNRALNSVRQANFSALNDQGNRVFIDKSYGEVAGILITEAKARGDVPDLTYTDNTTPGGDSPEWPVGAPLYDVLSGGRDEDKLEWQVEPDSTGQGRNLVCYDPDAYGTDRSGSVILREGIDFTEAPTKRSSRDVVGAVLVQGDDNSFYYKPNPVGTFPHGRTMDFVTASGISDVDGLEVVADARLRRGEAPIAEHTRQLTFEHTTYLPFLSYSLGDYITAPNEFGVMEKMRVRQVTLTYSNDTLSGNVVLGDRFTERTLILERAAQRALRNASTQGGSGVVPSPAPPFDNTPPPVSSALTAESQLTMVKLTWNGLDENGDPVDTGFDHTTVQRDTTASFTNPVEVGRFNSVGQLNDGPFNIGQVLYYRLVTSNQAGTASSPSIATSVTVKGVKGPDLEANSVTANKLNVGSLDAISANLGTVNAGTLNGIDINGSTITGGVFQTSAFGERVEFSDTSASGRPGMAFYDSTLPNPGFLRMSDGSLNITTPAGGMGGASTLAMSPNGFTVALRSSTVMSLAAPNTGANSSITVAAGMSITASNGNLNLNGNSVNINGSSVVTGSVVRPGDSPSFGTVYCTTLSTTYLANPSAGTGDPLHRNSSNGQLLKNTSSIRYKQDIMDLTDYERVLDLRPVYYKFKTEADMIYRIGVLAEETYEKVPELVTLDADGLPDGVQYQGIAVMLIPLVNELWNDYKARSAA